MVIENQTCQKCGAVWNPVNGLHACAPEFQPDAFAMVYPPVGTPPDPGQLEGEQAADRAAEREEDAREEARDERTDVARRKRGK